MVDKTFACVLEFNPWMIASMLNGHIISNIATIICLNDFPGDWHVLFWSDITVLYGRCLGAGTIESAADAGGVRAGEQSEGVSGRGLGFETTPRYVETVHT